MKFVDNESIVVYFSQQMNKTSDTLQKHIKQINHKTNQNFKNKIDQSLYYSIWYICTTISGAQCSCNTWSSNDMIMAHDIHRKDNFTEKVVFIFEDIAFCIALFWPIVHELIDPDDVCVMFFSFRLTKWILILILIKCSGYLKRR